MRRLFCLFMVVLMVVSASAAFAADDETKEFDSTLVKLMEYSPSKWVATEENRAYFTILAMVEYSLHVDSNSSDSFNLVLNDSYVLQDKLSVDLIIQGNDQQWLLLAFNTVTGKFSYVLVDGPVTTTAMKTVLDGYGSTYYKNEAYTLYTALQDLKDIFTGD